MQTLFTHGGLNVQREKFNQYLQTQITHAYQYHDVAMGNIFWNIYLNNMERYAN